MKTNTEREVIAEKQKDINNLSTGQIVWFLICRHKVSLLISTNVVTLIIWGSQQLPVAFHNFMR